MRDGRRSFFRKLIGLPIAVKLMSDKQAEALPVVPEPEPTVPPPSPVQTPVQKVELPYNSMMCSSWNGTITFNNSDIYPMFDWVAKCYTPRS